MKLLIAEDDITTRTMLTVVTKSWGYEPVAVEDGETAWQVLQADDPPRLLLLDWMMPELDGLALCQRIREKESQDPPFIVLLTARDDTSDIVRGLDAGANEYISKPIGNAELRARLQVGQRMLDLQAELNQTREALAYQAYHDSLTGLLNRRAVMEGLEEECARIKREFSIVCIAMCDIDHFKKINDTYGHPTGDAVLQQVAGRITHALRPYDKVGRYGGEEFLIVLPMESEQVEVPLDRLRRAISDVPFVHGEISVQVTMSGGATIHSSTSDHRDSESLIAAADSALYQAKKSGRNRFVIV